MPVPDLPAILATVGVIVTAGVAGWLAGLVVRGESAGCVVNILLGIVGGALATFIGATVGWRPEGLLWSIALAATGAAVVLVLVEAVRLAWRRRRDG
ncbi:GlsB/YeaQ/YmgE family stress response membrane protein [Marinivivus vitaminiproducens]|uniref:GlsB/YeaQ/YmgE family stress response membrane protein n=1 Tax=Marinivivus vitaminiproducens TaxID=3035935 RepID=UPI0027A46884|nr:GlsB/YeaQ/YmgE family stress response membrane protein [Geminicoccaceae bacterium SCSIO 64248]